MVTVPADRPQRPRAQGGEPRHRHGVDHEEVLLFKTGHNAIYSRHVFEYTQRQTTFLYGMALNFFIIHYK